MATAASTGTAARSAISTLPVGLRVEGRLVVVVGAGRIAARKAASLAAAGAVLRVVAPRWSVEMEALPVVDARRRPYQPGDLDGAWFVTAATGDPVVDGRVFADAEARRLWCNAADDPQHCSVVLPAVARRGDVSVAIATGGRSPAAASWLRRRIQAMLDDGAAEVVDVAARVRDRMRAAGRPTEVPGWVDVLDADALPLVHQGRSPELERRLWRAVAGPCDGGADAPDRTDHDPGGRP
jgi:precorrin-2 dehydrogenase / sirohydrochlorin ferrochelatase